METLIDKHPLQRLHSPHLGVSALVHVLGVASFASSFKYLIDHPNPATEAYGWHFTYLTILGLTGAALTFIFGVLADLTRSPRLFLLKNLFSLVSTPLEVVISVLYWGLSLINPRFVKPEFMEISLPADIGFHAIPAIALVIDLLFLSPPWIMTSIPTFGLGFMIAFGYWFWIEWCYSKNGWYPYPIFEMATREQRIALFALSAAIFAGSAISLKWLYGRVNGYGVDKPLKARPGNVKA